MKSVSNSILRRIRAKQRGWVFTPKDFIDIAPRHTIGVTLHRLLKKGIIRKLSHGMYDLLIKHPKLGILAADSNAIVKAIAKKKGAMIKPSGAHLVNQLGLDTQVPAKLTYITSGSALKKKIANHSITFRHSKFVNKLLWNDRVILVLNVLHYQGKNYISDKVLIKCKAMLKQRDKSQLKKNLNQLPDWMVPFILKIIGVQNERTTRSKSK